MVPIPELDRDMKITIRIESFSYDLFTEHFVCLKSYTMPHGLSHISAEG